VRIRFVFHGFLVIGKQIFGGEGVKPLRAERKTQSDNSGGTYFSHFPHIPAYLQNVAIPRKQVWCASNETCLRGARSL
jgi:hypothetical protein